MESLGKVTRSDDGRYTIRFIRRFAATPREVWAALTERDALDGWLGRVRFEGVTGSALTVDFGAGVEIRGVVVEWEPLHKFSFTWLETAEPSAESLVSFELFREGKGTRLTLVHTRQPTTMARTTAGGWHAHLDLLNGFLEGTTPHWDAVYAPAKAAYAATVASIR